MHRCRLGEFLGWRGGPAIDDFEGWLAGKDTRKGRPEVGSTTCPVLRCQPFT